MEIRKDILDRIRLEPVLFADVLRALNDGRRRVMPSTLQRRLERRSETVRQNYVIVDCLKDKGYTDSQIFEMEEPA